MQLRRIVLYAVLLIANAGMVRLCAATAAERDQHFATVIDLIRKEIRLVAEHQIQAFKQAGYPDSGGVYADTLDYYLTNRLKNVFEGVVADAYQNRAKQLIEAYKGKLKDLPAELRQYWEVDNPVFEMAQRIRRWLNPDAPPDLVPYTEEKINDLQGRARRLIEACDAYLVEQDKRIAEYDAESDKAMEKREEEMTKKEPRTGRTTKNDDTDAKSLEAAYEKEQQKRASMRYEYTNTFYQTYRVLREFTMRGRDFGLQQAFIEGTVVAWLKDRLNKDAEKLSTWDFQFFNFPFLRLGLATLQAEGFRLKRLEDPNLQGQHRFRTLNYDDIAKTFTELIDMPLKEIDRKWHHQLEINKLQAWSEFLYWHLAMGDKTMTDKAQKLWQDCQKRLDERGKPLQHADPAFQQLAGHLFMLMARIHHKAGDAASRDGLLAEVAAKKNFFKDNAEMWIRFFNGGAGGQQAAGGWWRPPRSQDPSRAITVGKALIGQAQNALKAEAQEQLFLNAAVVIREGIAGLPNDSDAVFVAAAPELYKYYGYCMVKLGWYYHASTVALDGLSRFKPELWGKEPKAENPWFKNGQVTTSGALVRRLSGDAVIYASNLSARVSDQGVEKLLSQAIDMQGVFDPEEVEDSKRILLIKLKLRNGDLERGIQEAEKYYCEKRDEFDRASAKEKAKLQTELIKVFTLLVEATLVNWQDAVDKKRTADIDRLDKLMEERAGALAKLADMGLAGANAEDKPRYEKAAHMAAAVKRMKYIKRQLWDELWALLGPAYFANPPKDEGVWKQDLGNLVFASTEILKREVAKYNEALSIMQRATDKGAAFRKFADEGMPVLLVDWAGYLHARRSFGLMLKRFPGLEPEVLNQRKGLSGIFQTVKAQARNYAGNFNKLSRSGSDLAKQARSWLAAAAKHAATRWGAQDPKNPGLDLTRYPFTNDEMRAYCKKSGKQEFVIRETEFANTTFLAAWAASLDRHLLQALDSSQDGKLSEAELDDPEAAIRLLDALDRSAKRHFADLFEPLCDSKTEGNLLLEVAFALWDIGEKQQASRIFETFKEANLNLPGLDTLRKNPEPRIDALVQAMGRLPFQLDSYWEKGKKARGNIRDLLIDSPDFVGQYLQRRPEELTEDKRDYGLALKKMLEFRAKLDENKGIIPTYAKIMQAYQPIEDMVRALAQEVMVNTYLVEAFREAGEQQKAVMIARELFAYDPKNHTYMREIVEGTLEAVRRGLPVTNEQITEAAGIAARLREELRPAVERDKRTMYWIAYCQVWELMAAQTEKRADIGAIAKDLDFRSKQNENPAEDLAEPVGADFALEQLGQREGSYPRITKVISATGTATLKQEPTRLDRLATEATLRFLKLFDIEGLGLKPPLTVETKTVTDPDDPSVEKTIHIFKQVAREQ